MQDELKGHWLEFVHTWWHTAPLPDPSSMHTLPVAQSESWQPGPGPASPPLSAPASEPPEGEDPLELDEHAPATTPTKAKQQTTANLMATPRLRFTRTLAPKASPCQPALTKGGAKIPFFARAPRGGALLATPVERIGMR